MNQLDSVKSSIEIDLSQSLLCGQVFRWKRVGDSYIGIDGSDYAKFSIEAAIGIRIENSNAASDFWETFFQVKLASKEVWQQFDFGDRNFSLDFSHLIGLRLLRPSNPLEVLFSFLCTSNNHLSRIQKMVDSLASLGETVAEIEGNTITTFPTLERLRSVSEQDLRLWGFGYRGATIPIVISQLVERGDGWLETLKEADYKVAHFELMKLAGVGPKLADCICLYGLHFDTAVPVDTHLHQAVARRYFPESSGKAMTATLYQEIGDLIRDKFGNLAGWAQLILYYDNQLRHRRNSSQ